MTPQPEQYIITEKQLLKHGDKELLLYKKVELENEIRSNPYHPAPESKMIIPEDALQTLNNIENMSEGIAAACQLIRSKREEARVHDENIRQSAREEAAKYIEKVRDNAGGDGGYAATLLNPIIGSLREKKEEPG